MYIGNMTEDLLVHVQIHKRLTPVYQSHAAFKIELCIGWNIDPAINSATRFVEHVSLGT